MSFHVVKFGGSNLKNSSDVKQIAKVIEKYNKPLVIVISAFYGVTNKLIEAVKTVKEDSSVVNRITDQLFVTYSDVLTNCIKDKTNINQSTHELKSRIEKLKEYLLGINLIGDVPDFLYDEIVCYGERLSSLVLSETLKSIGIQCEEKLPERIGLITDGEYRNSSVDLDLSQTNLRENLDAKVTYVIPGFYGISKESKITLLGRGGTDYSASSIAACLNASSLDVWKDVEGFLSADPKIVDNVVKLESLSYHEAAELAYFGSKILHPRTPEPLIDKKIPIRLFNIQKNPISLEPLTIINGQSTVVDNVIKSVSFSDDFGILTLKGPGVGIKPGLLAKATIGLDAAQINIKSVITSQIAINFLLSESDLEKAKQVIQDLDLHGVRKLETQSNITLIAAVGDGVTEKHGVAARLFGAVGKRGINIKIISFGASQVAVYFIVDRCHRDETINQIHQEFFGIEDHAIVERIDCFV